MTPLATCIGCGCDDNCACEGGCWWLRCDYNEGKGVCSECEDHVETWDRGDRTPHATPAVELEAIAEGRQRIPRPEQPRPAGVTPGGCVNVVRGGVTVHVQRRAECPHDWPFEDVQDNDQCRWCGISFLRHIFTECP